MDTQKILYFEAPDGMSGDMTLGALLHLGADINFVQGQLDKIIAGKYSIEPVPFERNGINGVNLKVETEEQIDAHSHRHYSEIVEMLETSGLSDRTRTLSLAIFSVLADAEAAVHNISKADVAFHEVGALDSIVDIVGTAAAIENIGAERFFCSALNDGSGVIDCQHGEIPVPVPAVMEMAKGYGVPIVINADVETEMLTPTGFAIIKGLGAGFEPKLGLIPVAVGYGFGKRETGRIGAVRATLGTRQADAQ